MAGGSIRYTVKSTESAINQITAIVRSFDSRQSPLFTSVAFIQALRFACIINY